MERLSQALSDLETNNKRVDQSHNSDRMSLVLEVERLHRDIAHHEADLDHARAQLEQREDDLRRKDLEVATLKQARDDTAAQLAVQTQARLSLSDKYDTQAKVGQARATAPAHAEPLGPQTLRDAQDENDTLRDRVKTARLQTSPKDARTTSRLAAEHRDQLADRNSLLQTVYQSIDRIIGTDKVSSITVCLKQRAETARSASHRRISSLILISQSSTRLCSPGSARFHRYTTSSNSAQRI